MNTFKSSLMFAALFLLSFVVIYGAYWGVVKVRDSFFAPKGSLIEEINKLVYLPLPEGETPKIVTLSNLEPLKNQPIFQNAKVGDTLLIFSKAKRAVLYRQSENKIIVDVPLTD